MVAAPAGRIRPRTGADNDTAPTAAAASAACLAIGRAAQTPLGRPNASEGAMVIG
jgi:hypothetical protein